jgi:hypothetical protein
MSAKFIQIGSPADHAIKDVRLASVAPAQNFDGKRFTILQRRTVQWRRIHPPNPRAKTAVCAVTRG